MASWSKGAVELSLLLMHGFDSDGSHDETTGRDANGNATTVPLHEHDVSMDWTRARLDLWYSVTDRWQLRLRVPYDVKDQTARVKLVDPATPSEQEEMQRNLDLHHRSEVYRGISDPYVFSAHLWRGVLAEDDSLIVAWGLSLPLGDTEENPLRAGEEGRRHLHIQFGSGTFDPVVEAVWAVPLSEKVSFSAFLTGRYPLYESSRGYRDARAAQLSLNLAWHPDEVWNLHVNYTGLYSGIARWDGVKDPNSGLVAHMVLLGAGRWVSPGMRVGLDVRIPFAQDTLGRGGVFDMGIMVLLSVQVRFNAAGQEAKGN